MLSIGVKKSPNHALILRVVLPRLPFEEFNAAPAQRNRDLDTLISEDEVLRSRKEVTNNLQSPERLIRVSDSRAHRLPYPFASSQRQRFDASALSGGLCPPALAACQAASGPRHPCWTRRAMAASYCARSNSKVSPRCLQFGRCGWRKSDQDTCSSVTST